MIGTRLGAYEILAKLGEGGMGEVYRARDSKLGREVAIKLLSAAFVTDPDRLARFEREARVLAALNHQNIAQVYGLEEGRDGREGQEGREGQAGRAGRVVPYLVMELLEGQSLATLLATGPLPPRKAIDVAAQMARGLAAAHDRGIIHRDLKPDNVFVLPDGRVKILDFGLARQDEAASAAAAGATLATTAHATSPGMVLGTVGYMAPEQVRAEPTDARSDLFSLGVVLYEMLSGQRPFRRDTTAETMTAILREDPPDLATLRADINPSLERIVRHCIEKNPIERFQTARDVAFALDTLSGSSQGSTASATAVRDVAAPPRRGVERLAWASLVVILAGIAAWLGLHGRASGADVLPPAYRSSIVLPETFSWSDSAIPPRRVALSRDGSRAALVGQSLETGWNVIWTVSLKDGVARPVAGTEKGGGPFWSPDGQQLGFNDATSNTLRRIPAGGGVPTRIQSVIGSAAWGTDDTIIVCELPPKNRVLRTTASGAELTSVFEPQQGLVYGFPQLLPGGREFLYASMRLGPASPDDGTFVRAIGSGAASRVLQFQDSLNAYYADGYLLFTRGSSLLAQAFDLNRRALLGEPSVLAENVVQQLNAGAAFSVSQVGSLVYEPQEFQQNSRLVWTDRSGHAVSTVGDAADYSNVELSPDGRRVAVSVLDQPRRTRDIYVVDLARSIRQRLTFDPVDERSAVWTADGSRLIYNSTNRDLYIRRSDFTGNAEPLVVDGASKDPREVSQDGRWLMYRKSGQNNDLWVVPLTGEDRTPRPIVDSPFDDNYGSFSPDGRSVAYSSNESGQFEVYVISLDGQGGKALISNAGGTFPRWRADGREIVYLASDQRLTSVDVSGSGSEFHASAPTPLFRIDPQPGAGDPYDVSRDGQHFIVNTRIPSRMPPSLTLIVNWPSLLKQRQPSAGQ